MKVILLTLFILCFHSCWQHGFTNEVKHNDWRINPNIQDTLHIINCKDSIRNKSFPGSTQFYRSIPSLNQIANKKFIMKPDTTMFDNMTVPVP